MTGRLSHFLSALWPLYLWRNVQANPYSTFTNYRRAWILSVLLLGLTAVVPFIILTVIDQRLLRRAVETENSLQTIRLTSNVRRSVSYFLQERLDALEFTVREVSEQKLEDSGQLSVVLDNLKLGFGGFLDLGFIDQTGRQAAYSGPFELEGMDYSQQSWFKECCVRGLFLSDVFLGYRGVPHIIIAVKFSTSNEEFFILRATLDTERLIQKLATFQPDENEDLFLINRSGIIQTPSTHFGKVLEKVDLEVPVYSERTSTFETVDAKNTPILVGYAYITTNIADTPFILILVRSRGVERGVWPKLRMERAWLFWLSLPAILVIIVLTATFMINKVYESDKIKAEAMLKVEQSSRMASIGRLAAGVAHEINNPLAVINESAGYIRDLLIRQERKEVGEDGELLENLDSILESVDRCSMITKQLLGFARHFEVTVQKVNLRKVINEVLRFFNKEAEYRNISIQVDVPEDMPDMTTDRGKILQILLNLVNNAFNAMRDGGRVLISAAMGKPGELILEIADTGCGIPKENMKRIFEPFFTTMERQGGTGLGLFITFGVVRKLGGNITVESEVGRGTAFRIVLPVMMKERDQS